MWQYKERDGQAGKRKCWACRYELGANRLSLPLSVAEWRKLLRWFLLGLSGAAAAHEAGLGRELYCERSPR